MDGRAARARSVEAAAYVSTRDCAASGRSVEGADQGQHVYMQISAQHVQGVWRQQHM